MVAKNPDRRRAAGHREASARITAELAAIDFPTTRDTLRSKVGDRPIEVDEGVVMPLAEMIALVPESEFATLSRALDAIDSQWAAFQGREIPEITEPGASGNQGR